MMKTPPYLKPGDTIRIISTARKVIPSELKPAVDYLKKNNFRVEYGKNLFQSFHQFAGDDEERAQDLQSALDDPDIRLIYCARGGYGTLRILDKINFKKFIKYPKWVAGFSDITCLLMHLINYKVESLHSPMAYNFSVGLNKKSQHSFIDTITGKKKSFNIPSHPLNRKGIGVGQLIGGNLSIITQQLGTSSDVNFDNCILFLEDLDEYLYHIDRMMIHLKRSKKINKLAGLIIGHFSMMKDNKVPFGTSAYKIIREAVKEFNYPVCFGLPVGHEKNNHTLIIGRKVKLTVEKKISLVEL